MRPGAKTITLHGEIRRQSDKAVLIVPDTTRHEIEFNDPREEVIGMWFPLSQVEAVGPNYLVISEWIAEKKGIQL
jgi:hypothetical protein